MKKYADSKDNLQYPKYENINDLLKARFLKAYTFEKALNEKAELSR